MAGGGRLALGGWPAAVGALGGCRAGVAGGEGGRLGQLVWAAARVAVGGGYRVPHCAGWRPRRGEGYGSGEGDGGGEDIGLRWPRRGWTVGRWVLGAGSRGQWLVPVAGCRRRLEGASEAVAGVVGYGEGDGRQRAPSDALCRAPTWTAVADVAGGAGAGGRVPHCAGW